MSNWSKVMWREGMFLCPQHLQAHQRHLNTLISVEMASVSPFPWGFQKVLVDDRALEIGTFEIQRCIVRLPSGAWVNIPDNTDILAINLGERLGTRVGQATRVYLALPLSREGRANAAAADHEDTHGYPRFAAALQEYVDENTGEQMREIEICRYRAKLLLQDEDMSGYEAIPVAQVKREASGAYHIVDEFVPPVLSVNVSSWLSNRISLLLSALRLRSRELATTKSKVADMDTITDVAMLFQLSVMNAESEHLDALLNSGAVAPYVVYVQLRRLLGQLAVFRGTRLPPTVPPYSHDDLGNVFEKLIREIESLLLDFSQVPYVRIPFVLHPIGMIAEVRPEIPIEDMSLYIGFDMPGAEKEEICQIVDRIQGKLAPASMLEELVTHKLPVLELRDVEPPAALPRKLGRSYLEVQKDSRFWVRILEDRKIVVPYSTSKDELQALEDINLSLYLV